MSGSPDALTRAYSLLTVKHVDEEQRIVTGIASTPETDRVGDVLEPKGASFRLPLPLLWQHRHDQPIGKVIAATVTDAGIEIRAQIAKNLLPRIDEAWALIRGGLVGGFSVGFRPTKDPEFLKGSGGFRFTAWELLEVSAVTIPANASASIHTIKAIDSQVRAASGSGPTHMQVGKPAVAGAVVRLAMKDASTTMKKTYSDQIKEFEATRQAKTGRMDEIMSKSAEDGVTLDESQKEEYDGLDAEVKSIDEHLVRLRSAEERSKAAAVAVNGANPLMAAASRSTHPVITTRVNRDPGVGFARVVLAKMASYIEMKSGNFVSAQQIAQQRWPSDTELHLHMKTDIPAATTTGATWATELVEPTTLGSEFLEFLRAQTIIGKFGQNGVPALKSLPFNIRLARMTSGLTGYWVGEGLGKPVSKGAIDAVTLPYNKVAALTVITQELARFSSPSAERVVRDELARSVSARIDADFVDPSIAAVAGVKPASITNGVTALSSAGTSADNARTDIMNLIEQFVLNHMDVSSLVLLMPNTLALALSILRNSLGQQEFPGLTMNGGTLEGIPVITSQYLASGASFGNMVIALSAQDIGLADDGAVDVKVSGEASLEMTDTPVGDSGTPTAGTTAVVSMFQTNSLAILAERFITWKKLRSTAVVYMDDVNWGAIGSPV